MTNRHQAIRDLVDAVRDQEEATPSHYATAEHWINEADTRTLPEAGRECLDAANAHALLAIADAVNRLTKAVEERPVACGVHCRAIGC